MELPQEPPSRESSKDQASPRTRSACIRLSRSKTAERSRAPQAIHPPAARWSRPPLAGQNSSGVPRLGIPPRVAGRMPDWACLRLRLRVPTGAASQDGYGETGCCLTEATACRLPPPVSTFFTISLIAHSFMGHGRCIDCAEAIGPATSPLRY